MRPEIEADSPTAKSARVTDKTQKPSSAGQSCWPGHVWAIGSHPIHRNPLSQPIPEGGSVEGPVVEASSDGPAGPRAPLTVLKLLGHPSSLAIPVVPSVPPPPTAPPAALSPLPFGPALCSQPPLGPIAPSLGSGAMNAASATGGDADTPAAIWVAPDRLVAATPRRSNAVVRLFP